MTVLTGDFLSVLAQLVYQGRTTVTISLEEGAEPWSLDPDELETYSADVRRQVSPSSSLFSFLRLSTDPSNVTGDGWCSKRRQAHFFRVLRLRPPEQCKHKPTKHDALLPHPRRDKHRNARDLPLRGRRVLLVARAVERHRPSHRPRAQAGAPRRRFVPPRRGQFTLSLSQTPSSPPPPPHPPEFFPFASQVGNLQKLHSFLLCFPNLRTLDLVGWTSTLSVRPSPR